MRESFPEEPRGLLSWLSNHIRSLCLEEKTPNSHSRPKGMNRQATRIPSDQNSSALLSRQPFSNVTATPSPAFHKFTLLPTELRLQIWELALFSTPRVIKFNEIININPPNSDPFEDLGSRRLFVSTPIPPSLQICRETRELALKRYIFSDVDIKLYLDPEIDSLYFRSLFTYSTLRTFATCAKAEDLGRLKRLVISERFLDVLGEPVWNRCGFKSFERPVFKFLSGLEDLILVLRPENGKPRGMSSLGPIFYERHCSTCREMDWWVGMDGWIFPTYRQFVTTERNGVEDVVSENAYKGLLILPPRTRSGWHWDFVNRRMQNVCKVDYNRKERKIRACSIAGLHRFVDLLNE